MDVLHPLVQICSKTKMVMVKLIKLHQTGLQTMGNIAHNNIGFLSDI